jgi:hypothetical protein
VAEAAQTGVAMHNFNFFSYYNVSEHWEERKDCGHSRLSVDDEKWDMIDLKAIGKIMYSGASLICMCDNDDLVSSVNEFLVEYQFLSQVADVGQTNRGELVNMTLNTT